MTTCPHHPGRTGNVLPECRWCIQESVITNHASGAQAVRDALAAAPKPPAPLAPVFTPPEHDLDDVRRRADQEAQP